MCGVSTAIWLQRFGHRVILIDKGQPGLGASFGNAGLLAQWAVDPVTSPKLWWKVPKYLAQQNSPFFMKWGYLPSMLPWLVKYMSHANDNATRRIVQDFLHITVKYPKTKNRRASRAGFARSSNIRTSFGPAGNLNIRIIRIFGATLSAGSVLSH